MSPEELSDIEQIAALLVSGFPDHAWKEFGDVKVKRSGDLAIFNYSVICTYRNRWNWFEKVCRGLILNSKTGEIVALPFEKFFNWGELKEKPQGKILEVTEKCDGSLGILYRENGEYKISTRGSFIGDQAIWATRFLQENYNLEDLPQNLTLLFEIIYPGNQIIIDYGERRDLVLLGVRDRFTKEDWFFPRVAALAEKYGFSLPPTKEITRIEDLLETAKTLPVTNEGWVVRFEDGTRVKVKGQEYLELARIKAGLSDKAIFEALYLQKYEDLKMKVPEELWGPIDRCHEAFSKKEAQLYQRIEEAFRQIEAKETRKEKALWLRKNCPDILPWVMLLNDGRSVKESVKEYIFKNYLAVLEEFQ